MMNQEQQSILLRQNKHLRQQLLQSNIKIRALQQQVSQLHEKLAYYQNDQTTINQISQGSSEQIFTQSSNSNNQDDEQQYPNFVEEEQNNPVKLNTPDKLPLEISKFSSSHRMSSIQEKTPKVFFNYHGNGKSTLPIRQNYEEIQSQRDPLIYQDQTIPQMRKIRSQIPTYKQDSSVKSNSNQGLFSKIRSTKKVFETFFVTGFCSETLKPKIEYYFPKQSFHFQALLELVYNENSLRMLEPLSQICKSPRFAGKLGKYTLKDTFVIPLKKGESGNNQYLVACQVEDYIEKSDKTLYSFNRMFCFLTSCQFFGAFKKIIQQFIQKINSKKGKFLQISPLPSEQTHSYLKDILQEHLQILMQKNIENNQYANFGLGDQIKVFIDIPSQQNSHKTLSEFNSWDVLALKISMFSGSSDPIRDNLLGFLVIYMLTEAKILLYSSSKSKISEVILHTVQFMRPLQYVNPVIVTAIKDQHQEYLDAPMPLILGLWTQAKNKRKQKLQIFVNRKNCLSGLIEEGKLNIEHGVVFNLDTGYTFGGGLDRHKNHLAIQLNKIIKNECQSSDDKYKLFSKIFSNNNMINKAQNKSFYNEFIKSIEKTQTYSCYQAKKQQTI